MSVVSTLFTWATNPAILLGSILDVFQPPKPRESVEDPDGPALMFDKDGNVLVNFRNNDVQAAFRRHMDEILRNSDLPARKQHEPIDYVRGSKTAQG